MRAVLAVHSEDYNSSKEWIDITRHHLDNRCVTPSQYDFFLFSSPVNNTNSLSTSCASYHPSSSVRTLLTESYGRAYVPLIMVQQCSELEEITEYKMLLRESGLLTETHPSSAPSGVTPLGHSVSSNNMAMYHTPQRQNRGLPRTVMTPGEVTQGGGLLSSVPGNSNDVQSILSGTTKESLVGGGSLLSQEITQLQQRSDAMSRLGKDPAGALKGVPLFNTATANDLPAYFGSGGVPMVPPTLGGAPGGGQPAIVPSFQSFSTPVTPKSSEGPPQYHKSTRAQDILDAGGGRGASLYRNPTNRAR